MEKYISCWQHFKKNYLVTCIIIFALGWVPVARGGFEMMWIHIITGGIIVFIVIANYISWKKTKKSLGQ